jgi:hypothetical protein
MPYTGKMADHLEERATSTNCIPNGMRQNYASFTVLLINDNEKMNSCNAARTFRVSEVNVRRWRQQKERMINMIELKMFHCTQAWLLSGAKQKVVA